MTAQLTAREADRLITALRHGQDLDAAAEGLGIALSGVWARARTDTQLAIALAGRDPDGSEEKSRIAHADFLRLLALGVTPSRAELIVGVSSTSGWRRDPGFARACDAVAAMSVPSGDNR
ncbi:hypothetical protein, partial [Streptomyces aureus]|uniref:hypothetical protein n=1 Tax=Streptomyces aureus TaxID=193461 RepID=UPI0033D60B19